MTALPAESHAYLQQAWNSGSTSSAPATPICSKPGTVAVPPLRVAAWRQGAVDTSFSATRAFSDLPQPPCPQPLRVLPRVMWQGCEGPWLGSPYHVGQGKG